ncbi:hypothetical protein, partial [Endozoicomonas sp. ONNA2]|uniref:hypothetical protein n=1 Tax=Endozoicomonas sp. ONNA2 TaxID=2828741 RepID=UPI002148291A
MLSKARICLDIYSSFRTQALKHLPATKQVISFGRILRRAAASKIETGEWPLFNNLKSLHESVAAFNEHASKVPEPEQIELLKRLKRNSPPG